MPFSSLEAICLQFLLLLVVGRVLLLRLGTRILRIFLYILKLTQDSLEERDGFSDSVSIFLTVALACLDIYDTCIVIGWNADTGDLIKIQLSQFVRFCPVFQSN